MKKIWLTGCLSVLAVIGVLTAQARAQSQLKPPLQGLISMGDIAFHRLEGGVPDNSLKYIYAKPGILDGVVLNFTWDQLESQKGAVTTKVIDRALAAVREYNKQYPKNPLAVRLRIYAGPNAPLWVKKLGGPPVKIQYRGINLTIGRFWSKPYIQAWRNLQQELARKYDGDPLVREVGMTSCSSITSEPLVLAAGVHTLRQMQKAGFSDGKYRECLTQATTDYLAWQNTRIEYPFNPFRATDFGTPQIAKDVAPAIMRRWRKTLGLTAVVGNHTLQAPPAAEMVPIYDAMQKLGAPMEFQLKAPTGMDWDRTIRYGISLGANAIEIWPATFTSQPKNKLKEWSAKIKRNKSR